MVKEGDLLLGGGGLLVLERVRDLGVLLREWVVRGFPLGDRFLRRGEGVRLWRERGGGEGDLCRAGGEGETLPLDMKCGSVKLSANYIFVHIILIKHFYLYINSLTGKRLFIKYTCH